MCQIFKSSTEGQTEVGTPRIVLEPAKYWQIDVCSGLISVRGYKSYLNIVDMYTGYAIPVPLKGETSVDIAKALETNLIKIFGPPIEISSDNAANLTGPPVRKLCDFYNIKYRNTVPYSPTSHALVEISNRYITQLMRIFSDQFQVDWTETICMAALVYNSVPRPQLMGHSPFFMLFQSEPFANNPLHADNAQNLDLNDYVRRSLNDRIFVKLLRERLLKIRELRNKAKEFNYKSYPKDSLILVRDLRPKVHKKLKPIYFKLPQKIVVEFKCTVYAMDIFGRVRKHSKNNIRLANDRTKELFSQLPENVKLALGDELNLEKWTNIKESGMVPLYLQDVELNGELGRVTRGKLPQDTHLIEQETPPSQQQTTTKTDAEEEDEEDDVLDELLSDERASQLQQLHDLGLLTDPLLTLKDIPQLIKDAGIMKTPNINLLNPDREFIAEDLMNEIPELEGPPRDPDPVTDPGGINVVNILPETQKRRVHFKAPVVRTVNQKVLQN